MKPAKTGAVSGCIVWVIVFGLLYACLVPVTLVAGSITSTVTAETVARILGPYLCPDTTTPEIFTYETTTRDENGFESTATAYEMRCVDESGQVMKDLGPTYAFIWTGLLGAAGLVLAAILAFLFAAPAGALIARVSKKKQITI